MFTDCCCVFCLKFLYFFFSLQKKQNLQLILQLVIYREFRFHPKRRMKRQNERETKNAQATSMPETKKKNLRRIYLHKLKESKSIFSYVRLVSDDQYIFFSSSSLVFYSHSTDGICLARLCVFFYCFVYVSIRFFFVLFER